MEKKISVGDMVNKTKIPSALMNDIMNPNLNKSYQEIVKETLYNEDNEDKHQLLIDAYYNIIELLKEYCDLKEEYYNIIALWIIGSYFHTEFPSYPYLYFNAMRGSGKSRLMNLVTTLSHEGQMLNSLTEAVLFRTRGCLGVDEFEGMDRKGGEALRELLNSGYKKGTKVKRMRKAKTPEGEEMVVEEFNCYRPIVMANISGIENVLLDRCIQLILEKSDNQKITNLMEIFDTDFRTIETKKILEKLSQKSIFSVVSVNVVSLENLYREWNNYIINYTNNTNNTSNTNNTNNTFPFEIIKNSGINGRDLELSFPLILISGLFGEQIQKETTLILKKIMESKKEESFVENHDIMLIDIVSQMVDDNNFKSVSKLVQELEQMLGGRQDWLNNKWVGRALKRLDLIIDKRRTSSGMQVTLNVQKAQKKMGMFR